VNPPYKFAETWIENWPKDLYVHSFSHKGVQLSLDAAHALGRLNGVYAHCFSKTDPHEALIDARLALDDAFGHFPQGAFIRLGSRSPKDTPLGVASGCLAENSRQALRLLTAGSHRMSYDLRLCVRESYNPWVFLREWRDCEPMREFRCLFRDGRLIGASQYHHGRCFPADRRAERIERAIAAICGFRAKLLAAWGTSPVVADVLINGDTDAATLIEVNPYGPPTDPCLLSWNSPPSPPVLRIRAETGTEDWAFPA